VIHAIPAAAARVMLFVSIFYSEEKSLPGANAQILRSITNNIRHFKHTMIAAIP
jgi:hypothetical protein